ncbi:hypothetical protein EI77_01005 [Prosthecobacter fusiformis]|uniref:Regulator of microtubule dynamics protein 1 n=1 Tax=Prosthecobacter fusiformis TaxID=48464 RepID=A0A4R7SSF4_9BACT|nr:hypothetical protein [Prosthecobacter fusiformis]TDU81695.1 hypothetical protein EI77_01005 [Prosthecobacter fusiformis]
MKLSSFLFGAQALIASGLLLSAGITAQAQSVSELVAQGEMHDTRLEADKALSLYLQAEKMEPNNADVLVRIARQYRHLMADASSKQEKLRLGGIALDYGKRAAALAPNNSDAQLSTAISLGKMLPLQDSGEQVRGSKLIKQGAEKAIKLNPRNDLAWHIIGRWHRNVSDISGIKRTLAALVYEKLPEASTTDAVKCLEKAIAINPKRLIHYIELGRIHAQIGNKNEARKNLAKGLKMPSLEKDDEEAKAVGRALLASM